MDLLKLNKKLRLKILETYFNAHAGHIGCSLSCVEILSAVFFEHKKNDDDFILSKGHAAVALYAVLNELGEITDTELLSFYRNGTSLPAHPAPLKYNSIPFATGSLGHGFPIGAGIAKANKLNNNKDFVYVLMSDGETNEGTTWEAAHFSVKHKLDNLILIIDKNKIQGFGKTNDILGDSSAIEKWQVLGFDVLEIDGHNSDDIINSIQKIKELKNKKPKLIIANTVKGKGVSFMENTVDWHYWPMTDEQYEQAKSEVVKS